MTTYRQIYNAQTTINKLMAGTTGRVGLAIARLVAAIESELKPFDSARQSLLAKYPADKDGKYSEDNQAAIDKAFGEMLDESIVGSLPKLKEDWLDCLTAAEIYLVLWAIETE